MASIAEQIRAMIDEEAAKRRALELVAKSQEGHPALIDAAQAQAARDATFASSYSAPYSATPATPMLSTAVDPRITAAGPAIAPTNPHAAQFLDRAEAARAQAQAATAAQAQRYNDWMAAQQAAAGTRQGSLTGALAAQLDQDATRRVQVNDLNKLLARNQVQNAELDRLRLVQQQARSTYDEQYAADIKKQTEAAQAALAALGGGGGGKRSGSGTVVPAAIPTSAAPPTPMLPKFTVPKFTPPGASRSGSSSTPRKPPSTAVRGPIVRRT